MDVLQGGNLLAELLDSRLCLALKNVEELCLKNTLWRNSFSLHKVKKRHILQAIMLPEQLSLWPQVAILTCKMQFNRSTRREESKHWITKISKKHCLFQQCACECRDEAAVFYCVLNFKHECVFLFLKVTSWCWCCSKCSGKVMMCYITEHDSFKILLKIRYHIIRISSLYSTKS